MPLTQIVSYQLNLMRDARTGHGEIHFVTPADDIVIPFRSYQDAREKLFVLAREMENIMKKPTTLTIGGTINLGDYENFRIEVGREVSSDAETVELLNDLDTLLSQIGVNDEFVRDRVNKYRARVLNNVVQAEQTGIVPPAPAVTKSAEGQVCSICKAEPDTTGYSESQMKIWKMTSICMACKAKM